MTKGMLFGIRPKSEKTTKKRKSFGVVGGTRAVRGSLSSLDSGRRWGGTQGAVRGFLAEWVSGTNASPAQASALRQGTSAASTMSSARATAASL